MSWSVRFLEALRQPNRDIRWLVESVAIRTWKGIRNDLQLASHVGYPGFAPGLIPGSLRLSAGQVHPTEWSYTLGQMSLGFVARFDQRTQVTRGAVVAVKLGFSRWDPEDFEAVFLGTVVDLRKGWQPHRWTLVLREAVAGLVSRYTTGFVEQKLFHSLGANTTIATTAYLAGDPLLLVASTTGFERETGGNYMIEVTPSGGGDPFLLTASGSAAGQFTGLSTTGRLGTTAVGAAVGSTVSEVALVEDHPVDVAHKILVSKGSGANGVFDTLPASWGVGVPQRLVDQSDFRATMLRVNPSTITTDDWEVISRTSQEDVLAWLGALLKPIGCFLTTRQGLLTARCHTLTDAVQGPYIQLQANDADIVSLNRYSTWDTRVPVEYNRNLAEAANGAQRITAESNDTRPARPTRSTLLPFSGSDTPADVAAWSDYANDVANLGSLRIPETIEVVLAGHHAAHLAPGDWLELNTRYHRGRLLSMDGPFRGGPLFISSVEPDWSGNTTRISAWSIPQQAAEL